MPGEGLEPSRPLEGAPDFKSGAYSQFRHPGRPQSSVEPCGITVSSARQLNLPAIQIWWAGFGQDSGPSEEGLQIAKAASRSRAPRTSTDAKPGRLQAL
jgi:hypothetical protein